MNLLDLPPKTDLPNADARRDVLVADISRAAIAAPVWRRRAGLGTAAAAATVALLVVPGFRESVGSKVLAYEIAAGDSYTYRYQLADITDHYKLADSGDRTPRGGVHREIDGALTYSVSPGPNPDTYAVAIHPDVAVEVSELGYRPEHFEEDESPWPDITVTVDEAGAIIGTIEGGGEDGVAAAIFPGPTVFSNRVGPPFSFGPPLPTDAVDVGDTWSTEEDPLCASGPPCPPRIGTHTIARIETLDGRSTWVIESFYDEFSSPTDWGPTTTAEFSNMSTTWFDPEAGIVMRAEHHAELHLRRPLNDGSGITMATDRTIDTELELVG